MCVCVVTSNFPYCNASPCYQLVCHSKQQRISYAHTSCNCVIFSIASETLPITVHPTNINRACPYTHSCSDAKPEAEAGKQTEACSHEKRATLSLLSSSPAVPGETHQRCRCDRWISTIHSTDGEGVKLCNLLFTSHSPMHAHTQT